MTRQEFNDEMGAIREKYDKLARNERIELLRRFIKEIPIKPGDTIRTDHETGVVRNDEVHASIQMGYPSISYPCDNITKRGTINKNNPVTWISEYLVKYVNDEEYTPRTR